MPRYFTFLFVAFIYVSIAAAQEYILEGQVLEVKSSQPIVGANVFYDGTSIGTITDFDGKFRLVAREKMTSPLIIRFLGYRTVVYEDYKKSFLTFYMEEEATQLQEVVLQPDTWSRARKMKVFKREFLGVSNKKCSILNENVIRLYYKKSNRTLYGYAEKPIQIFNEKLGYLLSYYLNDFEVEFYNSSSSAQNVKKVFYAGSSRFKEVDSVTEKMRKQRKKVYFGSTLHVFRSLYRGKLREEGYQLFIKNRIIPLDSAFTTKRESGLLEVHQQHEKIGILFDKKSQSLFQLLKNPFYVDPYGNYTPVDAIWFSGEMGLRRIGELLPLNFDM
ncbi:carboxypeptidase-like regulatory domain-containing protein [Allomuricauda sp. d1]|uniref:carboxypeptidase-like regulatory domain-containing protein n=1 Tax=Allomuricauda sp. d1 TaxID=3136725 RepID=UPI0031CF69E5